MPDGSPDLTYRLASRGRFAPLLMISGPSGTGKTYSALRLAKGMAGPDGKIFLADTDNSRGRLYADEFEFLHLDLREPFRPTLFEQAAVAAQKQGASVLIIDNFGHEWAGPGGILSWHEEELDRMAGDNFARREQLKMVVWGRVKPPHKHMLQRLYQINMAIILCCFAEKKIAMIKQTEGKDKGKVIPVDQGFQPVGDKDAAFAMTASLLLPDVANPGVPVPIKALLPALKPIIRLDRPLDEETGARIAAWARGDKETGRRTSDGGPAAGEPSGGAARSASAAPPPASPPPAPPEGQSGGHPEGKLDDSGDDREEPPPPEDDGGRSEEPPERPPVDPDEQRIVDGARALAAKFIGTVDRKEHLATVDNRDVQKQIAWLRRNRKDLWQEIVKPTIDASWKRTEPPKPGEAQQGDLMNDQADRTESDPGSG